MLYNFIWISSDFFLFVTWIVLLIYSIFYKKECTPLFFLKFSILFLILVFLYTWNMPLVNGTLYFFFDTFVYSNFIKMLKLFLIFLVLVIIIMACFVIETQDFDFVEFVIIMLIALQGLFLIISGNDLLINFLGIELQSLCFYILVGLRKHSNLGIEAAFKYFVLSAYSNLISLFGISFIYGFVGTTKLKEINILLDTESNTMLVLGVLFLFVGVFFKLAVFLFHYWIGDVYQGSLLLVIAFFAIVPKLVYIFFFFKLFLVFWVYIQDISIWLSCFSIVFGTVISMYQVSFRRLLAYSSLTHVGYMVLGISLNTIEGFVSAFFYLFIYIVLLIFTFIFLFCFVEKHSTKEIFYIDDISAFGIIAKKHYSVAFLFSTILLSMGGVPFFAGFYSKFYFFMALYSSFNFNLLFALLFVSVVSSIYYIRIIRFLLFTDDFNCNSNLNFLNLNFYNLMFIILIVFFFFNCVIFFFHDALYLYIQHLILVSFS